MDYEDDVSRELIKCVVVGDTGVGKTRLICAKACGQKPSLEQLINVHVPTVWAIDQYRICRDVLERSFEVVDGISIALRIWDTFGDHHNDRCFAYGRSDVVLLCFSVASSRSLEHAKTVWYPEIRRQRPNVPVLLVACKNDLRYLCLQPEFQRMLAERRPSPLKPVNMNDIVSPEHGRAAAKEIGAFYYETSVLSRFGVEETFQNAVRAALCRRRQGRLWSGHFQLVKFPQIQAPCLPPKPSVPTIRILPSCYVEQMASLILCQSTNSGNDLELNSDWETYYDCVLRVKEKMFLVHKLVLASSSKMFRGLFVCDTQNCRSCSMDECENEEDQLDTRQDCLVVEKSDKDFLLDDEDNDVDVFACLPVLHRSSNGGQSSNLGNNGNSKSSNSNLAPASFKASNLGNIGSSIKQSSLSNNGNINFKSSNSANNGNSKQHKRRKSADLSHRHNMNLASKNRHATVGGFLSSNQSSSSFPSIRSVHAKSATTINQSGLPDCVVSISEDYRCRKKSVISPLTIVTLQNDFSPKAVKMALNFMYCGELEPQTKPEKANYWRNGTGNLLKVVEAFEIDTLRDTLMEKMAVGSAEMDSVYADAQFLTERSTNLIELGLEAGLFSDVKFIVDDGVIRAQKFLLCARCDVTRAMFTSTFRESCLSQVTLPGVSVEALNLFLTYLFVDSVACCSSRSFHLMDFMEALELANRMCICRLVNVIEGEIVNELERLDEAQELNIEEVLQLLEPAQMCNAQQLVSWCFHYLCCNYSRVCDQCGKLLKALLPSNQDFIGKHRWPPLWYLKEFDWHEKMVREGQRAAELAANKLLKRTRTTSGCLCFSTRASARMQHNSI